jgi:hypothetical protein
MDEARGERDAKTRERRAVAHVDERSLAMRNPETTIGEPLIPKLPGTVGGVFVGSLDPHQRRDDARIGTESSQDFHEGTETRARCVDDTIYASRIIPTIAERPVAPDVRPIGPLPGVGRAGHSIERTRRCDRPEPCGGEIARLSHRSRTPARPKGSAARLHRDRPRGADGPPSDHRAAGSAPETRLAPPKHRRSAQSTRRPGARGEGGPESERAAPAPLRSTGEPLGPLRYPRHRPPAWAPEFHRALPRGRENRFEQHVHRPRGRVEQRARGWT